LLDVTEIYDGLADYRDIVIAKVWILSVI